MKSLSQSDFADYTRCIRQGVPLWALPDFGQTRLQAKAPSLRIGSIPTPSKHPASQGRKTSNLSKRVSSAKATSAKSSKSRVNKA